MCSGILDAKRRSFRFDRSQPARVMGFVKLFSSVLRQESQVQTLEVRGAAHVMSSSGVQARNSGKLSDCASRDRRRGCYPECSRGSARFLESQGLSSLCLCRARPVWTCSPCSNPSSGMFAVSTLPCLPGRSCRISCTGRVSWSSKVMLVFCCQLRRIRRSLTSPRKKQQAPQSVSEVHSTLLI